MASNPKTNEPQGLEPFEALDLQQGLGKFEAFWEQNKQMLTYAGGGLLALVLGAYYIWGVYLPAQQKEAVNLMHVAERYFENDSLNLAVKGDGNFPGFEEIAEDYRWTPAGNLARYYLGVSYLRLGQSKEALEALESFKTSDPVLGSISLGCQGDAHLQLKKDSEALVERLGKVLEEKVEEVRSTSRLTSSPACLVVSDGGMSLQLARMLKQAGQPAPESKPVLEVNPEHALVKKLEGSVHFHDLAHILFDQALLAVNRVEIIKGPQSARSPGPTSTL